MSNFKKKARLKSSGSISEGVLGRNAVPASGLASSSPLLNMPTTQIPNCLPNEGNAANVSLNASRNESAPLEMIQSGPCYYPTVKEFSKPLEYIESIRKEAIQWGICKIIPPEGWNPPMCADMQSQVQFETKRQSVHRLSEGNHFDDGNMYTPSSYQKYASECAKLWKAENYDKVGKPYTAEEIEKEYWKIVETGYKQVTVEYGNDIDTGANSMNGFPLSTKGRAVNFPVNENENENENENGIGNVGQKEGKEAENDKAGTEAPFGSEEFYRECWFNLNNIAQGPGSVLRHMVVPLNGVNVPWLYMGCLFSTFCWHNEDNYLYSINYHHSGAPKQWYGCPGTKEGAEGLETVFKTALQHKLKTTPDLLSHITTMFSPRLLQEANVPVCKLLQQPGEFVVTFPRAYHGGFSMGPNIGEAVNFATPEWISHGTDANEYYRSISRPSVFSQDRLTFMTANYLEEGSIDSLKSLETELERVIKEENYLRNNLLKSNIIFNDNIPLPKINTKKCDATEVQYDDKRNCLICQHCCFYSAVCCSCHRTNAVCLRHVDKLCGCPTYQKYLLVWISIDELKAKLETVRQHIRDRIEVNRSLQVIETNRKRKLSDESSGVISGHEINQSSPADVLFAHEMAPGARRNLYSHKDKIINTEPAGTERYPLAHLQKKGIVKIKKEEGVEKTPCGNTTEGVVTPPAHEAVVVKKEPEKENNDAIAAAAQ